MFFVTAERVASVYICTRKHGIIRFLYKIYVLIQVNMSVYWPYPKPASDCVQRDIWYLVNPRACSSALTALGTLQPTPSGLLNTIDPWTQSLTYVYTVPRYRLSSRSMSYILLQPYYLTQMKFYKVKPHLLMVEILGARWVRRAPPLAGSGRQRRSS